MIFSWRVSKLSIYGVGTRNMVHILVQYRAHNMISNLKLRETETNTSLQTLWWLKNLFVNYKQRNSSKRINYYNKNMMIKLYPSLIINVIIINAV